MPPLDLFTLLHAGWGLAFGLASWRWRSVLLAAFAWEFAEGWADAAGVLDHALNALHLAPLGDPSWLNSAADVAACLSGWAVASVVRVIRADRKGP